METGGDAAGRLRFNVARPFERTHTSFAESVAATQSRGSSGRLSGARSARNTRRTIQSIVVPRRGARAPDQRAAARQIHAIVIFAVPERRATWTAFFSDWFT